MMLFFCCIYFFKNQKKLFDKSDPSAISCARERSISSFRLRRRIALFRSVIDTFARVAQMASSPPSTQVQSQAPSLPKAKAKTQSKGVRQIDRGSSLGSASSSSPSSMSPLSAKKKKKKKKVPRQLDLVKFARLTFPSRMMRRTFTCSNKQSSLVNFLLRAPYL